MEKTNENNRNRNTNSMTRIVRGAAFGVALAASAVLPHAADAQTRNANVGYTPIVLNCEGYPKGNIVGKVVGINMVAASRAQVEKYGNGRKVSRYTIREKVHNSNNNYDLSAIAGIGGAGLGYALTNNPGIAAAAGALGAYATSPSPTQRYSENRVITRSSGESNVYNPEYTVKINGTNKEVTVADSNIRANTEMSFKVGENVRFRENPKNGWCMEPANHTTLSSLLRNPKNKN